MESFVVTTALLKYDLIMKKALNMEPFFNVYWEDGYFVYYQMILLKTLFVQCAIKRIMPKYLSMALHTVLSVILMRQTLSFLWSTELTEEFLSTPMLELIVVTMLTALFFLPFPAWICYAVLILLSLGLRPIEFMSDVFFVVGFAHYVYQGYGREFGKMAAAIFLSLGFMWLTITRLLTVKEALMTYILLILVIFPLMPKQNRVRLTHLNCLLSACLSYRYIRSGITLWMLLNPTKKNEEYLIEYRIEQAEK